jgi:hypothetical protein
MYCRFKKKLYLRSWKGNNSIHNPKDEQYMSTIKLLPYGISDFKQIQREGKYIIDKTMYISQMEETDNFLFLIRPRRFGKSVFLSMLRTYYDINERGNFQDLFKGLWIADHPTPEMGQFQVMYFDYSRIGGSTSVLERNFDEYCNIELDAFAQQYARFYTPDFVESVKKISTARMKLNYINTQAKILGHKLYLIIDEYDNFTNTVLNQEGEAVYHALTHANGFYRDIFKLFKGMFTRILMTGVSPVTMDDVTSGYNIASNISLRPEFNLMLGFSEDDVREMIRYYSSLGRISQDEETLIADMKPWYDNYCFSESRVHKDPKVFNCDMVLYYLNRVMQTGEPPRQMIDPNTKTDYKKMWRLIQIDKLDNYRRSIVHQIAEDGYIFSTINESFPADTLTDADNFVSLLYYYGMLTIGDVEGALLQLIIPNNNVRRQYYDWLVREYDKIAGINVMKLNKVYTDAALHGEWRPMLEEIARAYQETTSVRQLIEGERNLQGFMNAYLTFNPYYLLAPEVELNHGFCDFFLMPDFMRYPMVRHSYIIELKYLKVDATKAEAERQWHEAEEQIRQYAQGQHVRQLIGDTELHLLILQIRGYDMERMEEV